MNSEENSEENRRDEYCDGREERSDEALRTLQLLCSSPFSSLLAVAFSSMSPTPSPSPSHLIWPYRKQHGGDGVVTREDLPRVVLGHDASADDDDSAHDHDGGGRNQGVDDDVLNKERGDGNNNVRNGGRYGRRE